MKTIESRGLSAGSLYKLLFAGLFIPFFVLILACGVGSFFGYATISVNNQYVFGMQGLLSSLVMAVVLPTIMAAMLWVLMVIGLWLWTRLRTISLTIKE